ncbi:MAG: guanylate kinase [Candidatus Pacebacteria bacterium]|nr:guanylate kinase [Candidatus Paceibacterota bacterium]
MNSQNKKIIVFAGPSGVGKSTLAHMLLEEYDFFNFSISATTREPRVGETDEVDYHFLSKEDFHQKISNDEFIEWEEVYEGRFYGTLRNEVEKITDKNNIAIFDIDVVGALNIKKQYGDEAYVVFIKPESVEALLTRLRNRGTETEEQIQMRKDRFVKELSYENKFDYILTNKTGEIEAAQEQIRAIIEKHFK